MSITSIISLNQLISWFEDFQENHYFLKDFGFGEPYDIGTSRQMNFPYMWVTMNEDSNIQTASNNKSAIPDISFSIMFMDKINNQPNYLDTNGFQSDNSQEILSDTLQCVQDLIVHIQQNWQQYGVLISQDVSFYPAVDETTDKATGVVARFVLRTRQVNCIIPEDPATIVIQPNQSTYATLLTCETLTDCNSFQTYAYTGGTFISGSSQVTLTSLNGNTLTITGFTGGAAGSSGTSGTSGANGTNGSSGTSGANGTNGTSGINGSNGSSGTSGANGTNGTSGINGTNGSSGTSGAAGANGSSGTSGINGTNGSSGTSGAAGANGSSGTSGANGTNGSSGTSGISGATGSNGTSGTSGIDGTNGTSGTSGATGSSGTSGINGTNGSSGTSGINGTDGSSGTSGVSGNGGIYGKWVYDQSLLAFQDPTPNIFLTDTDGITSITKISISDIAGITGTDYQTFFNQMGDLITSGGTAYIQIQESSTENVNIFKVNSYTGQTGYIDLDVTCIVNTDAYLITTTVYSISFELVGSTGGGGGSGTSGTSGTSGINGTDGSSGTSGVGTNGTSGTSGINGTDGSSGTSGVNGTNGTSGTSGINGTDGSSGTSGVSGATGTSGTSGIDGTNGTSGTSGIDGTSGTSGADGTSGTSGIDGTSGSSGIDGTSGTSGIDGTSGTSGIDGTSGTSGIDGTSGTSGIDGTSGTSGIDGTNGSSGTSGIDGTNGSSGTSGINGVSSSVFYYEAKDNSQSGNPNDGHILWNNVTMTASTQININHLTDTPITDIDIFLALLQVGQQITIQDQNNSGNYQVWTITGSTTQIVGASNYWEVPVSLVSAAGTAQFPNNHKIILATLGATGSSGTSGTSGINGTSGTSGINGTDGTSGTSGAQGISGATGSSGTSGTSGISGATGSSGTSGTSGISGATGSSGTSGTSGVSGATGSSGTSGTSGVSGATGSSGTSGTSGVSGATGTSGTSGTSGLSTITIGTTGIVSGTIGRVDFQGTGNVVQQDSQLFWDNTNKGLGVGATPASTVKLDVRADTALSTDLAFRVRNSTDTLNLIEARNNGDVYVGVGAGRINTSTNSTFIGFNAGYSNTTGFKNMYIGYSAGYNSTGQNNLFFGTDAGYNNTTGGNNVFIGTDAGRYITGGGTANLISNDSIFLGSNSKANASNETNQIVIGYDVTGLGANSAVLGSSSITKTLLRGDVVLINPARKFGYDTGAGGTVTQITNKSTGVTLNRPTGQITMQGASLSSEATVSFTLTNSVIAAGDILVLQNQATGTLGAYTITGRTAAGSATISVRNITGGNLSEAIVISFAVIKAVTA